jgi:hypothetical protein
MHHHAAGKFNNSAIDRLQYAPLPLVFKARSPDLWNADEFVGNRPASI